MSQNYAALSLAALLALTVMLGNYLAAVSPGTALIIYVIYTLFYIERPKLFWFVYALALILSGYYFFYSGNPTAATVYVLLAFLECCRVMVVAVLKYPAMNNDLRKLTEELEQRVEQRTNELRVANEQLQRVNSELHELDKLKSAFVSQASHDLRTPLTAIKGSLDNLFIGVAGELNERQLKILSRALVSVDRLTHLINDILDLNRIESGRQTLQKSTTSLNALVQNSIQENLPAAQQKQVAVHPPETAHPFNVLIDPAKFERVVGELVGNAIKYTPESGSIHLDLTERNGLVELSVRDTGIGMTREECEKIWERFYRTDASQQIAKGSGLGLSIAKELVELHGGGIRVESEAGNGTTFIVTIPVKNQ